MMKRLLMLVTVIIAVILVSSLLISCTEPEESQTPTTTQPTTTASPTTTQPPETILIRMTTPVPPGDVLANMAQEGMDRFNARTNGLYEMKIFPGGQLVAFPESLDAIRTGAIEGGVIPLAAFGGSIPEFGLPELPFLYNNGEANAEAVIGIGEIWKEVLEEKANQTSVAYFTIGGMNLLCSKKMITSLDDFEGLVVGCDTPSAATLVEGLGGSGIVVDFTEDYSNLQKGVFDAKTSAPMYIEIAKLYEVAEYYTVFYGLGSLYAITINMDIYNAMPQEIKDILQEEMTATAAAMSEYFVNAAYDLQPVLEAEGLQYYFLPAAERDKWKDMVYPGSLAALEDAGDIGASIKAIIDEANAKYPYVE